MGQGLYIERIFAPLNIANSRGKKKAVSEIKKIIKKAYAGKKR